MMKNLIGGALSKSIFKTLGIISAVGVSLIAFQNCTGEFSTSTDSFVKNDLGASDLSSNSDDNGSVEFTPIYSSGINSGSNNTANSASGTIGYIYSSQYRSDPNDKSGVIVCDYPSGANCKNDAQGKSVGRTQERPSGLNPNARVHKLAFEFFSNGYFAKNREGHIAIGLRGHITKDQKNDPVAINGRGFLIGQLGGDSRNQGNPACSHDMAQIETYHGDAWRERGVAGNTIFPESCAGTIFKDSQWYRLEVAASSDRKIGYKVYDRDSRLVYSHLMQDPTDLLNPNLAGLFLLHVFDTPVSRPQDEWNFIVRNIAVSQSENSIESLFTEPLMSFYYLGTQLAENSLVTWSSMVYNALAIGNFSDVRSRIYGCASPADAVDAGTCSAASDFRVIERGGDESFYSAGTKLDIITEAWRPFPKNVYKLVIRVNPMSSYKQTVVRINKE